MTATTAGAGAAATPLPLPLLRTRRRERRSTIWARIPSPSAPCCTAATATSPVDWPTMTKGESFMPHAHVTSVGHLVDARHVCEWRSNTSIPLSTETRITRPTRA